MSTINPTTVPSKRLAESITGASTSFKLNSITGWDGNSLTSADFGSVAYAVFRNSAGTLMEIMEIDPTTITSASSPITINKRGLKFTGDLTTEVSGNKLTWVKGDTIVELGTHVPQLLKSFVDIYAAQTIAGVKTFSSSPIVPTPSSGTQAANKDYVDGVAVAGAPDANTSTKGIVEEATQAEVDARTTTGGTGAKLFAPLDKIRATLYHDYAADAGANDTYTITITPAPTAYTTGMFVTFKANTVNTGACTLNVNSLGAKSLKMNKDLDPVDGYIKAGQDVTCVYDGTNFQITSVSGKPSVSQTGEEIYAADAGSNDTYAVTLSPAPTAYTNGMVVRFKANTINTGAATLNVNGLGAKTIVKNYNVTLADGDIKASQLCEVIYDGTNFQLLSPVSGSNLYSNGVTTRSAETASGTQNIAHGLGIAPRRVKLFAKQANGNLNYYSFGIYDSSGQSIEYYDTNNTGGSTTGIAIRIRVGGVDGYSNEGVVSVDATNIIITWTRTQNGIGGGTQAYDIQWDAQS